MQTKIAIYIGFTFALLTAGFLAKNTTPESSQQNNITINYTTDHHNRGTSPGASSLLLSPSRSAIDIEKDLFVTGSLKFASLDGDWGVDSNGILQPSLELRRRFDQLLTTIGEVSIEDLTIWIQARSMQDVGKQASSAIMEIWNRYIKTISYPYKIKPIPGDIYSFKEALAERKTIRREILGPVWAQAFFSQEESEFQEYFEKNLKNNLPMHLTTNPLILYNPSISADEVFQLRASEFGETIAKRLNEEDEVEKNWWLRVDNARQKVSELQAIKALSEQERNQEIELWLNENFHGSEQLRVKAILGL